MAMLAEAWTALGGDADGVQALTVTGGDGCGADVHAAPIPGPSAVGALACATVGTALLAAAELAEARGLDRPVAALDARHVAAAFTSERHVLLDGAAPGAAFDPSSAFMATRDGWIRLHANYPHHRAALMRALDHPRRGADGLADAVASFGALELEAAVVRAGGCAAAVRDQRTWSGTPVGARAGTDGLLDVDRGVARSVRGLNGPPHDTGPERPMAGLRVLDLTRVIAGPVGTRTLAALGAQTLRVDAPELPELPLAWIDGGCGRRSTHLQLRTRPDRERLHRLLDRADVLVMGYRPGALDAFGLSPEVLAEKHPHLCTVRLAAWEHDGPWATRRGFDSLVQAASGIALEASPDGGGSPGVLQAQALDHGTGYLIAAAAMRALALRAREGRPSHTRVALARTAAWLLGHWPGAAHHPPSGPDVGAYTDTLPSPLGMVRCVRPPGTLNGMALRWSSGPPMPGADAPYWL